jgi:hypothetical protein
MRLIRSLLFSGSLLTVTLSPLTGYTEGPFEGLRRSTAGVSGMVDLKQESAQVLGYYSCCHGIIDGDILENQLNFLWKDELFGEGWGTFVLASDGKTLEGLWGFHGDAQPSGEWRAERFQEPTFTGTPTYWTLQGENTEFGILRGSAELYFADSEVAGALEGYYTPDDKKPWSRLDVFNYLEGTLTGDELRLTLENPVHGSRGTMVLQVGPSQMTGRWQTEDGTTEGAITFLQESEQRVAINLHDHVERQWILCRAGSWFCDPNELPVPVCTIVERPCVPDHAKALEEYEHAADLFQAVDDRNHLGQALLSQGLTHYTLGDYENARQQYLAVIDLGSAVDPRIVCLAIDSLIAANLSLGLDPLTDVPKSNMCES